MRWDPAGFDVRVTGQALRITLHESRFAHQC